MMVHRKAELSNEFCGSRPLFLDTGERSPGRKEADSVCRTKHRDTESGQWLWNKSGPLPYLPLFSLFWMRISQRTVWTSGVWGWSWWRICTVPSVAEAGRVCLEGEPQEGALLCVTGHISTRRLLSAEASSARDSAGRRSGGFVSLCGTTALVHCGVRRTRKEGTKVWSGSPAACSAGPLAVLLSSTAFKL